MMRIPIVIIILLVTFALPCTADIGNTLQQCIDQFGKPISHGKGDSTNGDLEWYAFRKGNYEFEDQFAGGIVVIETIWKPTGPNDPISGRIAFSQSELTQFLAANSSRKKWSDPNPTYKGVFWRRADGASSSYSDLTHEMCFSLGSKRH